MSEHTKTPWRSGPTGKIMAGYSQPFGIIQEGTANLIAGCFGDVKGGPEVARANAALIVRAVNSFEAMRGALETLINLHDGITVGGDGVLPSDWSQARAALKLAGEGQ